MWLSFNALENFIIHSPQEVQNTTLFGGTFARFAPKILAGNNPGGYPYQGKLEEENRLIQDKLKKRMIADSARDFGAGPVLKADGILSVFLGFYKPKLRQKIR